MRAFVSSTGATEGTELKRGIGKMDCKRRGGVDEHACSLSCSTVRRRRRCVLLCGGVAKRRRRRSSSCDECRRKGGCHFLVVPPHTPTHPPRARTPRRCETNLTCVGPGSDDEERDLCFQNWLITYYERPRKLTSKRGQRLSLHDKPARCFLYAHTNHSSFSSWPISQQHHRRHLRPHPHLQARLPLLTDPLLSPFLKPFLTPTP